MTSQPSAALGQVPLANLGQEEPETAELGYLCFLLFRIRQVSIVAAAMGGSVDYFRMSTPKVALPTRPLMHLAKLFCLCQWGASTPLKNQNEGIIAVAPVLGRSLAPLSDLGR